MVVERRIQRSLINLVD
jgi:hypothetical protein